MDAATAQAIHDLATTGRLSEDSTAAVADVLGLDQPDEGDEAPSTKADAKASAAKGSGR